MSNTPDRFKTRVSPFGTSGPNWIRRRSGPELCIVVNQGLSGLSEVRAEIDRVDSQLGGLKRDEWSMLVLGEKPGQGQLEEIKSQLGIFKATCARYGEDISFQVSRKTRHSGPAYRVVQELQRDACQAKLGRDPHPHTGVIILLREQAGVNIDDAFCDPGGTNWLRYLLACETGYTPGGMVRTGLVVLQENNGRIDFIKKS